MPQESRPRGQRPVAPQRKPAAPRAAAPKSSPPKKQPSTEEIARIAAKRREEARRRREREEAAREAEARRARQKRERRRIILLSSFLVALVFVGLYWAWVWLDVTLRPDGNADALPVLVFTKDERKEDVRFEVEDAVFDGVSYLPVTFLEPYVTVTEFGDYTTRSFLIRDTEEYATFYLDTCSAVINGERVSLKHPAFLKDNVLYLPLDFYSSKMNCFEYTLSSALGASVLTFDPSVTPSF